MKGNVIFKFSSNSLRWGETATSEAYQNKCISSKFIEKDTTNYMDGSRSRNM